MFKKFTLLMLAHAYSVKKLALFSVSGFKDEQLIKKANLHED